MFLYVFWSRIVKKAIKKFSISFSHPYLIIFFLHSSGIRLENLIHVVPVTTPNNYMDRGYLTFEDLTVVPIQQKMIEPKLLTKKEIEYINQYHQKCRDLVGPLLRKMGKTEGYNWLFRETTPICWKMLLILNLNSL